MTVYSIFLLGYSVAAMLILIGLIAEEYQARLKNAVALAHMSQAGRLAVEIDDAELSSQVLTEISRRLDSLKFPVSEITNNPELLRKMQTLYRALGKK